MAIESMPFRRTPLVEENFYHVLNRSVAGIPIFTNKRDFLRMMETINYCRFVTTPLPLSKFRSLPKEERERIFQDLKEESEVLVEIICFCLMSNHFHLLLYQNTKNGITNFLKRIQGSYGKYFNIRYKRNGPLFQNRFKAILVESEEQLLHLSRYIHLNPYSSLLVKNKRELLEYPWSSLPEYLGQREGFSQKETLLNMFGSEREYKKFIFARADYQRKLEEIKHLLLE